ncbi:hypothetical protein P153DRAFT_69286 [Dothidotthia symphoricarpi CBS 119687]|uniref:Cell wall proline rich protein n=1 Tax=Dothidotthia symphoricarpi CBS 119687 TaxID=1392245 RepID=A0A6A6A4M8_9PLEO|nr:uncharacterized protein P153DRAFT_69286 [Dothidotthia symphoricarpi CBS 119687]KAF2126760.1 hypothetical protein P153DRAFT_69286 [Dothidotthia symphoricarpi CBS 119687]
MAQIALPRHRATQSQSVGVGSPLYQRRNAPNAGAIELIPNPEFSFPMRDPDAASSEPTTFNSRPMSLQAYPAGRRGSMPHARQKSINTLPSFSFNPAGTLKPATGTSPPVSPATVTVTPATTAPATPSRPIQGHHKRGGSEFIGGDNRPGMSLLSSSPTKGEGDLPAPDTTLRPGPPAGRRGHAHRRSGAVSSHDLSSMMTPPPPTTGSAPATPLEGNQFIVGHSVNRSMSQPSLRASGADDDSAARPPSRARVGFSDTVEYIRPLSTISSETETSMSTIRCHSASNSLSSIVSGTQPARMGRPTLSTVEDEGRPSTAGAVLDKFMSNSLSGDVLERKRPMSAVPAASPTLDMSSNSPLPSKRRSFFSRNSDKSINVFPVSKSDPALSRYLESPLSTPLSESNESVEDAEKPKSASRKSIRKPRKVKSWANSIIQKKGRHSKKVRSRAPTPPTDAAVEVDDSDVSDDLDFEPNFDEDTTVTIVAPSESSAPARKLDTDIASWQPRPMKRVDSDIMSPIIDLDAALGPFNTPNGSSPRNQQRGFSAHRRAMHSFSGTAPSHRRTESAPELVPFEFRSSAAASSAAPMADVFEEEEPEDDVLVMKKGSIGSIPEESEEPKIQLVEADGKQNGSTINWNFNDGLGIKRNTKLSQPESTEPLSPRALPQLVPSDSGIWQPQQAGVVEVVEDHEEPRTSSLTHSSDSTVTQQPLTDDVKDHEPVMNVSIPLSQQSLMTPDTISSFPSPDYHSSQISFDNPRLGTAGSSMTDYPIMPSPRFGEPGPELRVSVDDVPSLSSSRSTMTIAMQHAYPHPSSRRPSDRSSSLHSATSEVDTRRRKRSSIASLSRLINSSSYIERSKLSIEQRPHSEHRMEPVKEKKKSNRLSKLMFWKSRESSSSSRV